MDDLTRFLSHHQPTIVHFSGHGSGTDELVLEDNSGHKQLVSTQALAKLFDLFGQQVECVLLNACYSEEQATVIHQHIISNILKNLSVADEAALITVGIAGTAQAVTLQTTDFIDNTDRTNFNGFEGLSDTYSYEAVYTEDGIKVEQVNEDLNDIWTYYQSWGAEGSKSWYPNGGDYGFTKITRQDSSDFENIGLLIGNVWTYWGSESPVTYVYDVLKNGVSLFSGTLFKNNPSSYIGFSGGNFHEIRLAAYYGNNPQQTIGGLQALAVDSIELSGSSKSVPEPGTLIG